MATDPMAGVVHRVDGTLRSLWRMGTAVTGGFRRAAEDAVDMGTLWIGPVRRLSAEKRHFAEQTAVWAERHRQLAEEMATWAEMQRTFADRLDALTEPILHYSEQAGSVVKGVVGILPAGNGTSNAEVPNHGDGAATRARSSRTLRPAGNGHRDPRTGTT